MTSGLICDEGMQIYSPICDKTNSQQKAYQIPILSELFFACFITKGAMQKIPQGMQENPVFCMLLTHENISI